MVDHTKSFDVDDGLGPGGPDLPKVFSGNSNPNTESGLDGAAVGSKAWCDDGRMFTKITAGASGWREGFSKFDAIGSLIPVDFFSGGGTSNKWLSINKSFAPSGTVPEVLLYNAELVGATVTNKDPNSEIDLEVWQNKPIIGGTQKKVIEVRDFLYAAITFETNLEQFDKGDGISVFAAKVGANADTPTDLKVRLWFRVTQQTGTDMGYTDPTDVTGTTGMIAIRNP